MKEFFYSRGKFSPVYFWIFMLMVPLITILIIKATYAIYVWSEGKIGDELPISDTFILGYLGFVLGWFGVYNKWGKNGNGHSKEESEHTEEVDS